MAHGPMEPPKPLAPVLIGILSQVEKATLKLSLDQQLGRRGDGGLDGEDLLKRFVAIRTALDQPANVSKVTLGAS
ncbi:MAG TPA: hypothetical protein VFA26_18615 [Gemmataceae bacterium]|nr:hypothetical protein [Gemmataceae bacterium]